MPLFWNNVIYSLKLMDTCLCPKFVDSEKKPTIRYIYEATDRTKETSSSTFKGKEDRYRAVFEIIYQRWNC